MIDWRPIEEAVKQSRTQFLRCLSDPLVVQQERLNTILSSNQDSAIGKQYRFATIRSVDEFREKVPIHRYQDLAPYVERMAAGERGVLVADDVTVFEETGGSTQGPKLIPYTSAGLAAFRRALYPWLADLLSARPGIKRGRAYWSVSPVTRARRLTAGRVPIGMANDAAYFGASLEGAIMALLAVPPEVSDANNVDDWQYLTLRYLLEAEDLTLISVWSPTFLQELMEHLCLLADRLIEDISLGRISPLSKQKGSSATTHPNPKRAAQIRVALSEAAMDTRSIWPRLDTISCWADARAGAFIEGVRDLFPHAWIQGKGLLATEGVVSIPLTSYPAPVLAVSSGFFEFLDSQGRPRLCTELVVGEQYQIVMTTHSGLYRYDLGDQVRMRGWAQGTPMLEFVGRAGFVSDLCGEKLSEDFVLARLNANHGFAMLAPSLRDRPHYALFLDATLYSEITACQMAHQLDAALRDNPQYDYARRLNQLGDLIAYRISNPMRSYVEDALRRGQRLGDIKPPVLSRDTDWEARFDT